MSKSYSDGYSSLRDDVRTFIIDLHIHIQEQNVVEIEKDTQVKFPKLTEQYFMTTRWPNLDIIKQIVDDPLFLMLYNELYYRHIYAHMSSSLTVEDRIQSYLNYVSLFNALLVAERPVNLVLPNQWLWEIIDEFLYQFQNVLNVLFSLVAKSNINELLSYYAKQGDPDDIADEFGRCVLYKMLGFFSLIGLCRLHCLLGDYYTAIKVLENIKFNRLEMYHEVPTCHITTGYYVGFSFMMMRSYHNAVSTLLATLSYKSRAIGLISQRADLKEYVNKQADQMMSLLAICITMIPTSFDYNVDLDRREKFTETLNRLQQLDEVEFASSFDLGCPKFISPETPYYAKALPITDAISPLEPQRQQTDLFKTEIVQQIELLRLRSYLKLYTNISSSKLANFMNMKLNKCTLVKCEIPEKKNFLSVSVSEYSSISGILTTTSGIEISSDNTTTSYITTSSISTLKSDDIFSSSSSPPDLVTNISTGLSTTTATTESVFIGRVLTQFNVKSVLYKPDSAGVIPWSDDYNNVQSKLYIDLSAIFCNLIISSLLNANTPIFQGARCTTVIFIRVTIIIRGKRQIVSAVTNSTSTDGVQGSANVELQTLTGSQLSQEHFTELLTTGYNQINKTSGALLNNLESTRISPVITCSNTQLVCGQHASCRNTANGVTCTCDPMWKDVNPSDPGKECSLHPGTIALIVFAGILLILAIIAIIYFIIKTNQVKKIKLKTNTTQSSIELR
ncbi:unnamed protein product [Schistosoma turkestanicum]|nr:unnamed protein product [Schistosoma turkestanicum]